MCPSRKCRLQDLNIGGGSFPKFDDWIVDAINDAQQEGQDIMMRKLSFHDLHIYGLVVSVECGPMVVI
jgi:hypothetical protein